VYRLANIDDFIDEPPTCETGVDINQDLIQFDKTEYYIHDSINNQR